MNEAAFKNYWFRGFCVLWAAATLFHQVSLHRLAVNPVALGLTIAAVAVLVRGRHLLGLVVLALAQLLELFHSAPYFSNHWLLTGFVNLALVGSVVVAGFRTRRFPGWQEAFASFVPAARALILGLYFWAVFHKLNSGFFQPEASCAGELLTGFHGILPKGVSETALVSWFSIAATLMVETAIPVLLFVRRTRHWGVLLGASFHFVLGFNTYEAYYNFSSALLALFWLFCDAELCGRQLVALRNRWQVLRERWPVIRSASFLAALGASFVLAWLAAWGEASRHWLPITVGSWLLYGSFVIGFLVTSLRSTLVLPLRRGLPAVLRRGPDARQSGESAWRDFLPRSALLLVVPAVFFLNGASPYLGGKTEQCLAMFSNLVTEQGRSNHFLIHEPLYLLPYQERVVRILDTDDPTLRSLRDDGRGMVWFEFRDHLSRHPETAVTYADAHGVRRVDRAGDLPELSEPTPWFLRKVLYFRHPDLSAPPRCSH